MPPAPKATIPVARARPPRIKPTRATRVVSAWTARSPRSTRSWRSRDRRSARRTTTSPSPARRGSTRALSAQSVRPTRAPANRPCAASIANRSSARQGPRQVPRRSNWDAVPSYLSTAINGAKREKFDLDHECASSINQFQSIHPRLRSNDLYKFGLSPDPSAGSGASRQQGAAPQAVGAKPAVPLPHGKIPWAASD